MRPSLSHPALLLVACICVALAAFARVCAAEPVIQLDTGGHTAPILGLAVSPEKSRIMLSGGYDKVIRVWDVNKGQSIRIVRGEVGPGAYGNIYALAASPRGTNVAVGGYMDTACPSNNCGDIRIFDWDTGKLASLLTGGHRNVVLGLAYSGNGRYLASSGGDDRVVFWNLATRTAEVTFNLPRRSRPSKIAFLGDDRRVAVVGGDGSVRVLDRTSQTREPAKAWTLSGELSALAVSLDGRYIAAGGSAKIVTILDAQSGEKLRDIDNGSAVAALAFGARASLHHLAVGTSASPFFVNVWNADTGDLVARHEGQDNTVAALTFSYSGEQVYSAGGTANAIHLWTPGDPASTRRFKSDSSTVFSVGFMTVQRPAAAGTALLPSAGIASTAPRSELYLTWGRADPCPELQSCPDQYGRLEFAMRLPTPDQPSLGKPERLTTEGNFEHAGGTVLSMATRRSSIVDGDLRIERVAAEQQDRFPTLTLRDTARLAKKPVQLLRRGSAEGNDHLSYTFSAGGSRIYSGGRNGVLDSVDPDGGARLEFTGHSGDVFSVVDSPTGQLVASGSADHTVRLWNAATGEHIVTLLYLTPDKWVMWMPQGYYASSPQGDRLVGWQVNKGRDAEGKLVTVRNLNKIFFNPKAVELAILRGSAKKAMQELGLDNNIKELETTPKPKLKILSPRGDNNNSGKLPAGDTALQIDLADNDSPIESLTIYINDLKFDEFTGPFDKMFSVDIPLEQGSNFIRVVARNGDQVQNEEVSEVECSGGSPPAAKGKLILIAIGVNKYPNKTLTGDGARIPLDLRYSIADARSMLEKLGQRLKGNHASVEKILLVNDAASDATEADDKREPTKVNIEKVLDIVRKTTRDDTLAIFVAGHGVNFDKEGYIFLPTDAQYVDDGWDSSHSVRWHMLQGALQSAKGRRYLFVDTCQSAGAVDEHMLKRFSDDDIVAFTAASRKQDSWERAQLGHGVFTAAVLAGLDGEADRDRDHRITVLELGNFVVDKVLDMTDQGQMPDFYRPRDGRDFGLTRY